MHDADILKCNACTLEKFPWFNFLLFVHFRYCNQYVDKDALLYLIAANEMLHLLHPNVITIAEDVRHHI